MKAIVLGVRNGRAALLLEDGTTTYRRMQCRPGERVEVPEQKLRDNIISLPQSIKATAAAAVMFLLVGTGYFQARVPVSYVTMDVNPSMEYALNRSDKVVEVSALNEDAEAIVEELSVSGKPIVEAVNKTEDVMEEHGYLANGGSVLFSVSSDNDKHEDKLEAELSGSMDIRRTEKGREQLEYSVVRVSRDERKEAKKLSLSAGRFKQMLSVHGTESASDKLLVEEFQHKPVDEMIRSTEVQASASEGEESSDSVSESNTSANKVHDLKDGSQSGTTETEAAEGVSPSPKNSVSNPEALPKVPQEMKSLEDVSGDELGSSAPSMEQQSAGRPAGVEAPAKTNPAQPSSGENASGKAKGGNGGSKSGSVGSASNAGAAVQDIPSQPEYFQENGGTATEPKAEDTAAAEKKDDKKDTLGKEVSVEPGNELPKEEAAQQANEDIGAVEPEEETQPVYEPSPATEPEPGFQEDEVDRMRDSGAELQTEDGEQEMDETARQPGEEDSDLLNEASSEGSPKEDGSSDNASTEEGLDKEDSVEALNEDTAEEITLDVDPIEEADMRLPEEAVEKTGGENRSSDEKAALSDKASADDETEDELSLDEDLIEEELSKEVPEEEDSAAEELQDEELAEEVLFEEAGRNDVFEEEPEMASVE